MKHMEKHKWRPPRVVRAPWLTSAMSLAMTCSSLQGRWYSRNLWWWSMHRAMKKVPSASCTPGRSRAGSLCAELTKPRRIPNMHTRDPGIRSWAKKSAHATWQQQANIHQGVTVSTTGLVLKEGNICATAKMPSQVKMAPQMAKAYPAGVTRLWYFSLNSSLVAPKAPVKEP